MPEVRGKLWGVILFLLVAPLFAIEIIGSVRDATTGLPVAEASVTLGSRFTSTDASGRFSLSNAIAGEYRIVVTHVAYNKFTTTIRLHDGANPPISISLTPKIYTSEPISTAASKGINQIIVPKSAFPQPAARYIEKLPGIALIRGNGDIAPTIRGSRPEDVLVVVDGIPLPRNEKGYCDLGRISIPIRSVEVLTDNIPAEYSALAPAGVILIESRRKTSSGIRLSGGSFGKIGAKGNIGLELPKLDLEIAGSFEKSEGDFDYTIRDTAAVRENNRTVHTALDANARRTGARSDVALVFGYHDIDEGMPGDVDHPTPTAFRRGNGFNASFRGDFILPTSIDLDAKFDASKSNLYYYIPRPYVYVPVEADHILDSYGAQISLSKSIASLEPTIGGRFSDEGYALENRLSAERSIPRKGRRLFSYWIQGKYTPQIADLVSCNLLSSVRWDDADSIAVKRSGSIDGAASGSFFGTTIGLSAGYSEALHFPEYADLYWLRDAFAEGNPDLAPERSFKRHVSISAAYENSWARFYASSDLFSRTIDSVIVWKKGFDGLYRPQNFSREESHGREDRLRLSIAKRIELSWSNTTMVPIQRSPDRAVDSLWIPYKPGYHQQFGIEISGFGLKIGLDGSMVGKRYTLAANTKWTEPYETWDAHVEYRRKIGPLDAAFRFDIANLTDEKYEILNGFPMPGRSWRFGIDARYNF